MHRYWAIHPLEHGQCAGPTPLERTDSSSTIRCQPLATVSSSAGGWGPHEPFFPDPCWSWSWSCAHLVQAVRASVFPRAAVLSHPEDTAVQQVALTAGFALFLQLFCRFPSAIGCGSDVLVTVCPLFSFFLSSVGSLCINHRPKNKTKPTTFQLRDKSCTNLGMSVSI
jgi:hypothetical protein